MSTTIRGLPRALAVTVIPGATAGAHTIDGHLPASGSLLLSVRQIAAAFANNGTDLTSEFSITDLNTIDNTAGTDTTGDYLVVTYAVPASL